MVWALSISSPLPFFLNSPPTVSIGGQRASLHGGGPPVVFSSGLFGLMPRRIYSKLFQKLKADVTLVVLDDASPVTVETVEKVADVLGVEEVGFLSHSSFDGRILESHRVRTAVLCDPVTVPTLSAVGGVQLDKRKVDRASLDALVIKAAHTYDGVEGTPIPDYLLPNLASCREITFPGVGHADVLDDTWAEVAVRTFPFMSGARVPRTPFADWSFRREDPTRLRELRDKYREELSDAATSHFLKRPNIEVLTDAV